MIFRAFLLLLLAVIPNICLGETQYDYERVAQDAFFAPATEFGKLSWSHMLPVIEKRMQKTDAEFVKSVQGLSDDQKIVKYNNYLAEKVFNDYENLFLWDMQDKSKQTGREIKYETVINEKTGEETLTRWLDRGILDTERCRITDRQNVAKNNSEYEINKARRYEIEHTCLYPDGFEQYWMEKVSGGPSSHIYFVKDNKAQNVREVDEITMRKQTDDTNNYHIMLDVDKNVENYQEYYAYLNQFQQDILDGYHNVKKLRSKNDNRVHSGTQSPWTQDVKSTHMKENLTSEHTSFEMERSFSSQGGTEQ